MDTKSISMTELIHHLSDFVREAQTGKIILIEKFKEEVVAIVPIAEYRRLKDKNKE